MAVLSYKEKTQSQLSKSFPLIYLKDGSGWRRPFEAFLPTWQSKTSASGNRFCHHKIPTRESRRACAPGSAIRPSSDPVSWKCPHKKAVGNSFHDTAKHERMNA